ncbi:MAG: 2-phospho-L-lactate transferase CofD family protein, partial [Actinomycetota bacterium]
MRITALTGGVGGARFLRGLRAHLDRTPTLADSTITVIGNTGDDINLFGLRVCPDLDTVMYTLGGGVHEEQGWGRADETRAVQAELAEYGAKPQWFGLGDRDFGTHIARSQWLGQG